MRRISSTERFPAASPARLIQNSNYGNLSEVPTNGGSDDAGMVTVDLNAPSTSRRVSRVRKSTAISPDQIRLEISQRAEELRTQGLSNPAFAEEDGQLADRMRPLPHFPSRDGAVAWRSQKISVGYDPRDVTPSAINYDDDGIRPTLDDLRRDLVGSSISSE
ncbi:hypothetical protein BV898_07140 [Hypsibius exemplaris]|uniref:Uncharacterized protein n=1 Tax=Hypsibius exemplaris TaxID=2072580 RepID=A0A1W0WUQ5_HYPEX|nr:hypothetical protein BV898_07140 [Hypsibius exemplaris]